LGNKAQSGFTITELTVSIAVASIIILALMASLTNFLVIISRNNVSIDMAASSQNLLRSTIDSLRLGDGVRQTNVISDPNAPAGGWNTSNSTFVIVIETPAYDSTRNFIIDPDTGNPYMNELVYYKSGTTLLRRNLANPNAVGNTLKTSCPAAQASASCPVDRTLADYVDTMDFTLYDQNNGLTSDPSLARSIKIELIMQRTVFGNPISLDNNIRVTLRNKF
jgi:prepilin-type N-terminal cleavage/methylation domain-containing protein